MCLNNAMTSIKVSYSKPEFQNAAEQLAIEIGLDIDALDPSQQCNINSPPDYHLNIGPEGLSLLPLPRSMHGPIMCQFEHGANSHRRKYGGGNGQAIAKAVGLSGKFSPNVLDLTAGLGGDSFVLAGLGCRVKLLERNAIVHSLLRDGFLRAQHAAQYDSGLADAISRMQLHNTDAQRFLTELTPDKYEDMIYMDPMFPERKKRAKVKKEMQAFHQIVGADQDATDLLPLALERARYRVVIKRPAKAAFLGGRQPSYSLEGKSTRFDIFALRKLPV